MNERQWVTALQASVLALFAFGLVADLFGMLLGRVNTTAFVTVAFITGGGIILLMIPGLQSFTFGVTGIKAEFRQLKEGVDTALASQQETLRKLVIYSLAEIIYRELLWPIGHTVEVECDQTDDQQRWLTFLFDHGLLEPQDISKWPSFHDIDKGQNLSDIFKPTPAAEYLMNLRGAPKPA